MRLRSDSGLSVVADWVSGLPDHPDILDLGCGHGLPLTPVLLEVGASVHAIDAAPTMVAAYQQNFPEISVNCETVERSDFFGRQFDGIMMVGLMFLLPETEQRELIRRIGQHLRTGGHLLFSSPRQICKWEDLQTGRLSRSLGIEAYTAFLEETGLCVTKTAEDEGGSFYVMAQKR